MGHRARPGASGAGPAGRPWKHPGHLLATHGRADLRRFTVVWAAACACAVFGLGPPLFRPAPPRMAVVVDTEWGIRQVELVGRPTVAVAMAVSGVPLVGAHLLTAKSHQPIAGHDIAPALMLDGSPASATTVIVGPHHRLVVVPATNEVEAVVVRPAQAIPPPPRPRVLRTLWHPGTPGERAETAVGAVSGEVLNPEALTPPSSPTPVTDKEVALTFDDGPWPDTPAFLAVLQAAGIKATFCTIGRQVAAHPDWVKQLAAAGMTICNHTMNHNMYLDKAVPAQVEAEVQGGATVLRQVIGQTPALYRPPGGTLSPLIEDVANALGEQVLHWSVDPSDFRKPGAARIVARVMAQVGPGSIIGLHDGGGDRSQTLAALPIIIDLLKAQGYTFTTPDAVSPNPLPPRQPVSPT